MTDPPDWSVLTDACGSAEHVPALLDRFAADPEDGWSELLDHLCPALDTAYSAGFAALPRLAALAATCTGRDRVHVLTAAGCILSCATTGSEVFTRLAAPIAELHRLADRCLAAAADPEEYVHLLQALLSFEGVETWDRSLDWLPDSEYEVACPYCGVPVRLLTGTAEDCSGCYATTDEHDRPGAERTPLCPTPPDRLRPGLARRLHARALADGHRPVAHALRHLFGPAACPDCATPFTAADQVTANW
ncbi:hypothetical protein ACFC6L_25295 [Kitasatospora phosalacinea]|uniref:hypothetical protein n=1 Tax=Kitasatospora phosalacinea TaxID=2065 RepID=UPI0035D76A48